MVTIVAIPTILNISNWYLNRDIMIVYNADGTLPSVSAAGWRSWRPAGIPACPCDTVSSTGSRWWRWRRGGGSPPRRRSIYWCSQCRRAKMSLSLQLRDKGKWQSFLSWWCLSAIVCVASFVYKKEEAFIPLWQLTNTLRTPRQTRSVFWSAGFRLAVQSSMQDLL